MPLQISITIRHVCRNNLAFLKLGMLFQKGFQPILALPLGYFLDLALFPPSTNAFVVCIVVLVAIL